MDLSSLGDGGDDGDVGRPMEGWRGDEFV